MNDSNPLWHLGIIIVLLSIEAVMSSAKAALESINENSIRKRAEEDKVFGKRANRVLTLLEHEEQYLDTARVLVSTINIIIGALYFSRVRTFADWVLGGLNSSSYGKITEAAIILCIGLCLLFVLILFGQIIPCRLTLIDPERTICRFVVFYQVCHGIIKPFVFLLNKAASAIFGIMRINPDDLEDNVTEDEIISIVNEGFEQGLLEDTEVEMISNIIKLDDKEVRDVMTNRKKVVSVNAGLSVEEALRFMLGERYSRFPLYEGEKDNILGVIHFKDVTQKYITGDYENVTLKELARSPYFVPDTQSVDTLLEDMQLKKIHMAIAVDEYGQMAGVVAMEDILEEIVGNIFDEYDIDERMILKQGSNRYVMRGGTLLEEVEKALGIDMEMVEVDIDTLNGFLIYLLGHLPGNDEKPVLYYGGYRFHVLDAKNNMIRTVRVVKETERVAKEMERESVS